MAATGSYLSSFTLAVTEVTERAKLPMLTLSYSDLITAARLQVHLPDLGDGRLAGGAVPAGDPEDRRKRDGRASPKTVAIITDNTAPRSSSVKPMRERLLKELGLAARGRRDLHAAARRRHAAGAEGPRGAARPAVLPADGHLGRQARSGEDERVRHGQGQGPDHLVRHRDRRAGHAEDHVARTCCTA